ncbi:uncharacterized protein Z518_10240 [Rhinocladiella mackenziei CBS 650.93]|uniref:Rhinocladiella mackenziei CBS 650.93 unplaced genomic scaffold supercont1.9, whole genome shotgun sequence n=1 Tax=Rhinocladiella mackenziei CBS 650.93 TaxID=1442369 RepID=A0A0D2GP41_9EURO|nr:uncharacterized protein Z518_10240 [Rhinocladiella mackenziei CBS 650.93]KIX00103.1 hypothetical protein Z518_10240 [Rhinocladiella mackenziei CBS 650.93]
MASVSTSTYALSQTHKDVSRTNSSSRSLCRDHATYFETLPYRVNHDTGIIDYDRLEENAVLYRPKCIVAGTSAYCRLINYAHMRQIADRVGAYLIVDMAHIAGPIAAEVVPSPFEHADVVTTTTHKSLRGPRGAMIFFRKGIRSINPKTGNQVTYDLEGPINFSVFPGHQGGPHNHTITALAVTLKQAPTPEFRVYQEQTHTCCSRTNQRHVQQEQHSRRQIRVSPCGIRIGTPAMTSRGFGEKDFKRVALYVDQSIKLSKKIQTELPKEANKLKDFKAVVANELVPEILKLKTEITQWASTFPLPV